MRARIARAFVAALIAGTLLVAGAAPLGEPGPMVSQWLATFSSGR